MKRKLRINKYSYSPDKRLRGFYDSANTEVYDHSPSKVGANKPPVSPNKLGRNLVNVR